MLKEIKIFSSLLLSLNILGAAEIYVTPSGNDLNQGTQANPLASLEGARELIASNGLAGKESITVWVAEGEYHMAKALLLGPGDSGTASAPIYYRAIAGAEVTLKGSQALNPNAWKPWKDGIYMQSLKGTALEGTDINQLFMADARMIRARYPNWDFENPLRYGKGYLTVTGGSQEHLNWKEGDLDAKQSLWKKPQEAIVHAFQKNNWGNMQFQIANIDWANRQINFGEGGLQMQRRSGLGLHGKTASQYYIENVFEELDTEFEWYLDSDTQMLYFKPPADVAISDVTVEAATISRLVEFVGAQHVHFEGFHLTQTRATFMDTYTDLARGDWAIHRGGAVYFLDSNNCSIKDFHIEEVGGNGIFVDGHNREIHISGCLIEHTGDSGVAFVGNEKAYREYQTWVSRYPISDYTDLEVGPKTDDYPANCSVSNTITRDVGVYGKQTSGVIVSMAMDITISHCSVYRIPRAGITFNDGAWGGHIMEFCDIYDTILDTGEHGPFNGWGRERYWNGGKSQKELVRLDVLKTTILRNNRVGNYRAGVSAGNWTIDLDDGCSDYEIYNNLMLGSTLKLRDGYYRKVYNNIIVSAIPIGLHCWFEDNSEDIFKRNITVVAGGAEGSGRTSGSVIGPGLMPDDIGVWGSFDYNLWWNLNADDFSAGQHARSLEAWQEKQGKHSVFADPLFVDPANGNYQVKPESPALKLGFKNFPMDQFGHRMTRIMQGDREFTDTVEVVIRADARGGEVRYTLDGSRPTKTSTLYTDPLIIDRTTTIRAATFNEVGHEVGFPDVATVTKVEKLERQSWLASLLAGKHVGPDGKTGSASASSHGSKEIKETLPEITGRYVRIELPGDQQTLSLAEVQVFEKGANVAIKGFATQINTRSGAGPERAIDGNTSGDYQLKTVTHTEQDIANPWWEVDLGRSVAIERIVIFNRSVIQNRLDGYTLKVLDTDRKEVFVKAGNKSADKMSYVGANAEPIPTMELVGMDLVTISDYPDYIDASGGQFFGAFVRQLEANSKAAKAGFRNGDTLIKVGEMDVRNLNDLDQALKAQPGVLTVKVFRGYEHVELELEH